MITAKTVKDLKPVLMDKAAPFVKNPYYLISDKDQQIFVVSPGQNGVEYNKTEGYVSDFLGVQTYISLYGSGVMLMQRNDEMGEAKEFKVVTLNPFKQVNVPVGWAMCLVNTGSKYLIVLRNSSLDEKYVDSKAIMEKRGLAYYVLEKKGEIVFEPNPYYQVTPQITTE